MTNNLLRRLIQDSNRTHCPVRVAFNTVVVRLDTPLRADIESVAIPVEAIKVIGEQDNELPSEVPAK